jgi:hypothetical protein
MMLPTTTERVPAHTSEPANRRIRRCTEASIVYVSSRGPQAIEERLRELDREWDIERALEANAASVALAGTVLGLVSARKWFLLPVAVGGFLLQHALQGWCPPVEIFRQLGFRTRSEIEYERYSLRILRGDFRKLTS